MKMVKKVSLIISAAAFCTMATGCYEEVWDEEIFGGEEIVTETTVPETPTDTTEVSEAVFDGEVTEAKPYNSQAVQTVISLEKTAEETTVSEKVEEPHEIMTGGFNNNAVGGTIPEDSMYAWNNAFKNSDEPVPEPLALLGNQVVGGLNHSFLCKAADGSFKVYTIYERRWLDKSEIKSITDISLNDLEKTDYAGPQEKVLMMGSWSVYAEDYAGDENLTAFPANASKAFTEARKSLPDDFVLLPQAYLGSQVVAGTNYRFLCVAKDVDYETNYNASIKLATVYEDLKGNCSFIYFSDINASDYVTY